MSEPESQSEEPKPSERRSDSGSVFGNLPKQRPGSRSPRRAADSASKAKSRAKAGAAKRPAPPKRAARPTAKQLTEPASSPPLPRVPENNAPSPAERPLRHQGSEPIGGIEDLAWAGVTVAAQAATVGVKLASRALEAVRKSVERT